MMFLSWIRSESHPPCCLQLKDIALGFLTSSREGIPLNSVIYLILLSCAQELGCLASGYSQILTTLPGQIPMERARARAKAAAVCCAPCRPDTSSPG